MRDPIKVPGDVQKVRIEPYLPVNLTFITAEISSR